MELNQKQKKDLMKKLERKGKRISKKSKRSKICVNAEYENPILSELSITPDLAILELETRFPNMKDFSIPVMSQTNSFYPQEKSSESGI